MYESFDSKFWFIYEYKSNLSIGVSFVLVGIARRDRQCGATLPLFWEKTFLCSVSISVYEVVEGLESTNVPRGSFDSNVSMSEVSCHASAALISFGGVEMSEMSIFSGIIGLSSTWVGSCCAFVVSAGETTVRTLNGFIDRLKSLRLGGMMGFCGPYLYGIASWFEAYSVLTKCGSGDTTNAIVITSLAGALDNYVKLRMSWNLTLAGICSTENRST